MTPTLLLHEDEVDSRTGFRYRTVYVYNENGLLHYHDYYEIFLILAPEITHVVNNSSVTLPRGSLVFIRKSDVHSFAYKPTKEPSFINITFTEEILMSLFTYLSDGYPSEKLLNMPDPPCVHMNEADIDWYIKQLEMLNSIETTDISTLKYQLRFFLMKLFTRYFSQTSHPLQNPDNVPRWLYNLHKEMQKPQNFSQDINHMVAMSNKSREYLGRVLKQYYGVTITEYINDLRLNYWANILTNSDIPILDSCYECGFQNVSWAYSLFKKKFGVSPLKYRNSPLMQQEILD